MVTRFANLIIAGLVLTCSGSAYPQTKPTAREILRAMVAQYRATSSYQDTGAVMLIKADPDIAKRLIPHSSADRTLVSFRTYFARPRMFRFDWKSSTLDWRSLPATRDREATIWSNGKGIYQWMPSGASEDDSFTLSKENRLDFTVLEAQRSSGAAVYPLISLFIKEANIVTSFADILDGATDLSTVTEESVEGEMCYVFTGNLDGAPWTFWVSKQRRVLRKTRTVYSYGSFDEAVATGVRHQFVAEETRRDIKLNQPIARDVFNYRPKLQPRDLDATR